MNVEGWVRASKLRIAILGERPSPTVKVFQTSRFRNRLPAQELCEEHRSHTRDVFSFSPLLLATFGESGLSFDNAPETSSVFCSFRRKMQNMQEE